MDTTSIVEQAVANMGESADTSDVSEGSSGVEDISTVESVESAATELTVDEGAPASEGSPEVKGADSVTKLPAQAEPQAEPQDELLRDEFKGNKNNRIPYNRVKVIVENAKKKVGEEFTTKISEYEGTVTSMRTQMAKFEALAARPEQFMSLLNELHPGVWTPYLQRGSAPPQDAPRQETLHQPPTEKPQPDLQLADGTLIYSAPQQEKLAEWHAEQRVAALDKQYSERFGPMAEEYAARRMYEEAAPRIHAQLTEARTWPQFGENEPAIKQAMLADQSLSLDAAYRKIVFPKLQSSRDTMRAELLAEINGRAASVSTLKPGAAPAAAAGPQTTEDIVRAAAAGLKAA